MKKQLKTGLYPILYSLYYVPCFVGLVILVLVFSLPDRGQVEELHYYVHQWPEKNVEEDLENGEKDVAKLRNLVK